jgi:acyl-CoA thioesterase-1
MLRTAGYDVQVWNAGVTGDTFERMFARLDRYVPGGMKIVVLQGGYNDLLRRSNPAWTAGYLQAIVSRLRARQIKVVLCGFFYPDWDAVRIALAEYYGAVFVDGGSCYDRRYRGLDGLHMTAAGHQVVAGRLFAVIQRLLAPAGERTKADQDDLSTAQPTKTPSRPKRNTLDGERHHRRSQVPDRPSGARTSGPGLS